MTEEDGTTENAMATVEQPPEAPTVESDPDNMTVHTTLMLYRFIPIGKYVMSFDRCDARAHISGSTCGGACCCAIRRNVSAASNLVVRKQPLCNILRLLRDAALAFPLAFMFHLVPAVIWGPETSLGSSSNHIIMGYVWFVGWPVWFGIMQLFLRPWGIEVTTPEHDTFFVPFASYKHASEVVSWWQNNCKGNSSNDEEPLPQKPQLRRDPWFMVGWFFALFLVINMVVTGVLVMQCSNRGCCVDNGSTLDCCVETGYPDC